MAPDGFRDGRGRMSTLPPVAFDDRPFKNPAVRQAQPAWPRPTSPHPCPLPLHDRSRRSLWSAENENFFVVTGQWPHGAEERDFVSAGWGADLRRLPVHGRRFALFLAAGLALGLIKISACCNPSLQNSRKAAQIWTALSGKGLLNHVLCSGQCCILQYSRNSLFWAVSNQYAFHLASHASPDRW